MKNTDELASPNADLKSLRRQDLRMRIRCGGSLSFIWTVKGDAAVKLEDDDERCGGGEARAAAEIARGRR